MTQAKDQDRDYDQPLLIVTQKAQRVLEANPRAKLYQKFTCSKCHTRQHIDVPNVFYKTATCGECGHITDITKQGCGFLAHLQIGNPHP